MTRFGIVRFSGAALIALSTAAMIAVGTAGATGKHDRAGQQGGQTELSPGDPRAVVHDGNIDANNPKHRCEDAGLTGEKYDGKYLEAAGYAYRDNTGTYITITALPEGMTVTGIIVKGSHGYNVYEPGKRTLSDTPPWEGLHPPIAGNSNSPAQISHWLVCETGGTPPTCTEGMPGGENGGDCTPPPCEDKSGEKSGDKDCAPPPCDEAGDKPGRSGGDDECTPLPCEGTSGEKSGDKDCTPPPCDDKSGDMSGGDKDCTPATPTPTPTASVGGVSGPSPSPSAGGEVEGATPPGKLANTGFNAGLSLGIAGLLLVVGVLMLAAPNHLAVAVGRLRRRG